MPLRWSSPQLSVVAPSRPPWPGCVSISGDADAQRFYEQTNAPRVLAWQPLAGGFLAGHRPDGWRGEVYDLFDTAQNRARRAALAPQAGQSPQQAALGWVVGRPRTHAIIGTGSLDHWRTAEAVAHPRLPSIR